MHTTVEATITDLAAARWATAHSPRLARIMPELVRHLHDFARTVDLTEPEFDAALAWLRRAVHISDDKRDELILASDILGLSMLLVDLNHRTERATPATVLGPFHIAGSPRLEFGADMSGAAPGTPLIITGTVRDTAGAAVADAVLDVWQADAEGAYEAQTDADEARLRGRYTSRPDGAYCIRTIAPLGYSIPMDGPVGDLVAQTAISHYRPAHVHVKLTAPGCEQLVTHLFERGTRYLDTDVVFGTRPELVVEFHRRDPGPTPAGDHCETPWLLAHFDFILQRPH
jgi:hydroxyquinol 1,2-dioxygenase